MNNDIACFMIEKNGLLRLTFRRYAPQKDGMKCPVHGYHDARGASMTIPDVDEAFSTSEMDKKDDRWPIACDCGYVFQPEDEWQLFPEHEYRRVDNVFDIMTLRTAPAGAMWFAPWLDDVYVPQLEHVLCVKVPGNQDWVIDSEASNCTMPAPMSGNVRHLPLQKDHHCWIIEGRPPLITVSKNGRTCQAGAGSIGLGNYHGFLRNGFLTNA